MDYVDGKSDSDAMWCPGVVFAKENAEGEGEGGAPGSSAAGAGLVVDVLGQAQAEFPVMKGNLTGFPGFGENLETVRNAVVEGLVSFFFFYFFSVSAIERWNLPQQTGGRFL